MKNYLSYPEFIKLKNEKLFANYQIDDHKLFEAADDFSNKTGFSQSLVGRMINSLFSFGRKSVNAYKLKQLGMRIEDEYMAGVLRAIHNTKDSKLEEKITIDKSDEEVEKEIETETKRLEAANIDLDMRFYLSVLDKLSKIDIKHRIDFGLLNNMTIVLKNEKAKIEKQLELAKSVKVEENDKKDFDAVVKTAELENGDIAKLLEECNKKIGSSSEDIKKDAMDVEKYNSIMDKQKISNDGEELIDQLFFGKDGKEYKKSDIINALIELKKTVKVENDVASALTKLSEYMPGINVKEKFEAIKKEKNEPDPVKVFHLIIDDIIKNINGDVAQAQNGSKTQTESKTHNFSDKLYEENTNKDLKHRRIKIKSIIKDDLGDLGNKYFDEISYDGLLEIFKEKPELKDKATTEVNKESLKEIELSARLMYAKSIHEGENKDNPNHRQNFIVKPRDKEILENKWLRIIANTKGKFKYFLNTQQLDPIALVNSDTAMRTKFSEYETNGTQPKASNKADSDVIKALSEKNADIFRTFHLTQENLTPGSYCLFGCLLNGISVGLVLQCIKLGAIYAYKFISLIDMNGFALEIIKNKLEYLKIKDINELKKIVARFTYTKEQIISKEFDDLHKHFLRFQPNKNVTDESNLLTSFIYGNIVKNDMKNMIYIYFSGDINNTIYIVRKDAKQTPPYSFQTIDKIYNAGDVAEKTDYYQKVDLTLAYIVGDKNIFLINDEITKRADHLKNSKLEKETQNISNTYYKITEITPAKTKK